MAFSRHISLSINEIETEDSWFHFGNTEFVFSYVSFPYQLIQEEVLEVDESLLYSTQLWMSPEMHRHTRIIYGILELFGDLGGVFEFVMVSLVFLIEPFSKFDLNHQVS